MNTLSPELHFPKPPFRIDRSSTEQPAPVLADYLGEIRSWRLRVLEFLAQPGDASDPKNKGLTERAKLALVTFLAGHWASGMAAYAAQSPYNISPFPTNAVEALASPTMEPVLEVLRWRAGVNDYLGDICDVMGEPTLELDECMALGEFLRPEQRKNLCHMCLTEFPEEKVHPDAHDCPVKSHVRAKWPRVPYFERLSTSVQKKWWEFWK